MKLHNKKISIVVPVFNESTNISPFYERMSDVLDSICKNWEIVFVNDGSIDDTIEKIKELHTKDNRIKAIDFSRNFGKEIAMTAGLDYSSGDCVIPIDVDLQDPPELIKDMVKAWQDGADVVYATRTVREGETISKKLTASLFYKFINKISNISIPENTGDFRLMDKKVLKALKEVRESNRFMKGLFSWVGFKQVSLEYTREPRFSGNSKFNYWKLLNFAIEGITSFSIRPLQLATIFGVLVSFFAFIYAVIIISKTIIFGADVPGYPSMMVTILFIGGIQLITIGVIGEYVGRIYNEVKKRPLYIIDEKIGL